MSHFHGVRFYESTDAIANVVASFLGAGFITQEPAVVIATAEHRAAIASALRDVSFSLDALQLSGNLLLLDAHDTLAALVVNGVPDAVRFESVMGAAFARLGDGRTRAVRAYDEMVDVLWKQDAPAAAGRLETLWDRLAITRTCSLLCGHEVGDLCAGIARQSVCAHHSHVVADDGLPHPLSAQ